MAIGSVDRLTTQRVQKKIARKTRESAQSVVQIHTDKLSKETQASSTVTSRMSESSDEQEVLKEIEKTEDQKLSLTVVENMLSLPSSSSEKSLSHQQVKLSQTRMKLSTFARTCDRYGIADRPAAALASALMHDLKKQDVPENVANVVDRSKVRRERKKMRLNLQEKDSSEEIQLSALYFDGRKDKTICMTKPDGGSLKRILITEEHISIINEPGSSYLGHVSPVSGTALGIKDALCAILTEKNIDTSKILAIGCDGTAVNTGNISGVICRIEKEFGRRLHWVVCQLHSNELPLRHIIQHLDGMTSGPRGFSGLLGKALERCEELPVMKYQPIKCEFPNVDRKELSTDQKFLFDICKAVDTGEFPTSLATRNPGKLSHARWLTTANRVLRFYVTTADPSENLREIATFVIKVYAPMWFHIKANPTIRDAPKHLWRSISLSRYLRDDLKQIVNNTIQRNGFFAHPESLLTAMLADDRRHVRELAVRRILSLRTKKDPKNDLRKFLIPEINFSAQDYIDLIVWQECNITEPTLTQHLTEADLKRFLNEGSPVIPLLFNLPCHTQAVERCVKVVTEASLEVCGALARDGFIRTRLLDRKLMPNFETKCHYKPE